MIDSLIILDNILQMSKNSIFTYNYFQPEDYRFSLDSVFLSQKVAEIYKDQDNLSEFRFLDLCSGCGIIGLELAIHLNKIQHMDFVEVQSIYLEYFKKNLIMIRPDALDFNFIHCNYQNLRTIEYKEKYDVIMSNPPYFFIGEGLLSPNEFKNRCRFFIDSTLEELISSVIYILKPTGSAFLLIRPGSHHGRNLELEIKKLLPKNLSAKVIDDIRGTHVLKISKETF